MNLTSMMNQESKRAELLVGHNYGEIFGLKKDTQAMIYNGGISWTAKEGEREMTMNCEKTTQKAWQYINPNYTF